MPNAPRPAPNTIDINITRMVTDRLERENPNMDRRAMAEMITQQKRQLAQDIHAQLDAQERKLFPLDRLERRLDMVAQEMRASDRVHAEAPKEGWMSKIGSALTYPFRHPWESAKFVGKAALVTVIVGTIGAIAAMYGASWIERLLQTVGVRRITGAGEATEPLGVLGGGPNVVRDPAQPSAVDAGGRVRTLGDEMIPRYRADDLESPANLSFENLWGQRSGPIVPTDSTPGMNTRNALPVPPRTPIID